MPVPEPVAPLEPWQTAWPAGVALAGLLVAAWRSRAHLVPKQADRVWLAALVGLALVVRLVVVPALSVHYFDGHEAEYWDIFRGVRPVNRGGTVLYPSMQWMWWAAGVVLPQHRVVPIAFMGLLGALGCAMVASAVARWTTRLGGLAAGLVLALHPVHAAWSTSAYNVVVPWFFSAVVVWSASTLSRTRRPPVSVVWMASFAWALVAATRMEAAWIAAPALLVALLDAPEGQPRMRRLRSSLAWALPLGVGVAVAVAAVVPLVYPGEVPGAGERSVSFLINRAWLAPYAPLDGWAGLVVVGVLWGWAGWQRHLPGLLFAASALGAHLVLATFDDFGDRHTLGALFSVALVVGVAAQASGPAGLVPRVGAVAVVVLCAVGLLDMRDRFYGAEERYAELLRTDARWADLPRIEADEARRDCGWIAEDPRVAPLPQKSHFNLIDPLEADGLRGPDGCLRWCLDVQDWRWSSRGVRDRALRTARLYSLTPTAVVEDLASGYACLVMELGSRRCCLSERPGDPSHVGSPSGAPAGLLNEEDDASRSLHHSPVP